MDNRVDYTQGSEKQLEKYAEDNYEKSYEEIYPHKESSLPAQDPLAHRATHMRCKTCMWFVLKDFSNALLDRPNGNLGRCRRHAPGANGFVPVFELDWCGDHRLDESKV